MSRASVADPRTYRGRTVEELLPKIQDELGANAIIVRRREGLTGGIAGFFQRRFVELEATEGGPQIDVYDEPNTGAAATFTPARELPLHRRAAQEPEALSPLNTTYVSERLAALARAGPLPPARLPQAESTAHLPQEVAGTTDPSDPFALMLERASSHDEKRMSAPWPSSSAAPGQGQPFGQSAVPGPSASATAPASGQGQGQGQAPKSSRARTKIQEGLLTLGTSEQFAEELIDGAAVHIRPFAPRASLSQAVRSALTGRIPVAPPLPARGAAIVLVGPGGAGKTSCCAALL
ncbi:MAG: hypothetical protein WBV77_01620, partial [Solirubrobacteraceae bacterium]